MNLKNGELVTQRPKTEVVRIAKLWPETIKALKALPRQGEAIFHTSRRSYTTFSVLEKFRAYREAAGFGKDVVFSMLRDAGFSTACSVGDIDRAKMLAGHKLPGVSDFYLKRNVGLVADACTAIHKEFFGKSK